LVKINAVSVPIAQFGSGTRPIVPPVRIRG
jgi:hypothetical protein